MIDKICSKCGYSLSKFKRTGLLGCPDCYKEFESEMIRVIDNVQADTVHRGKKPKISFEERRLISDYNTAIKEKEKAGVEGRFTDMAKLNLRIQAIGEELKRRGLL